MAAHDHDHDHDHEHGSELSETQLRVRALETVLTEKGYIDPAALDAIVEAYETKIGPRNGRSSSPRPDRSGVQEGAARRRHQGGRWDGPHEASATIWSRSKHTQRHNMTGVRYALLSVEVLAAAGLVRRRPIARAPSTPARRAG
jgi:hypothetical protein